MSAIRREVGKTTLKVQLMPSCKQIYLVSFQAGIIAKNEQQIRAADGAYMLRIAYMYSASPSTVPIVSNKSISSTHIPS